MSAAGAAVVFWRPSKRNEPTNCCALAHKLASLLLLPSLRRFTSWTHERQTMKIIFVSASSPS